METKLNCIEASDLIWNAIWKKDGNNSSHLHILDSIKISEGEINGWLFTSTNGIVKSKLIQNWNINKVLNRCNYFQDYNVIHYYDSNINNWIVIKDNVTLELYVSNEIKTNSYTYLLCHPLLNKNSVYMEITYTKLSKHHKHIEIPQYTCSWLYNQSKRSKRSNAASFALSFKQQQLVLCKDKEVIKLSHDFINYLIKFIENPTNVKVTSMKVIVMIVSNNSPDNVELNVTRSIYFHHIVTLTFQNVSYNNNIMSSNASSNTSLSANNNNHRVVSSQLSNASGLGELSLLSSIAHNYIPRLSRVDCCHGDFCNYMAEDAHRNRGFYDFSSDNSSMTLEEDFNFRDETQKAINRHRRYEKPVSTTTTSDHDNNTHTSNSSNVNIEDELALETTAQEENRYNTTTSSDNKDTSSNNNSSNNHIKKSINNKSLLLGKLKLNSNRERFKVMGKSIALARQEMIEIENYDEITFSDNSSSSNQFSFTSQNKKNKNSKLSSNNNNNSNHNSSHSKMHSSYAKSMNIWPESLMKWWLGIGQNQQKNSSSIIIPASSAHQIDKAVLAIKSTSTISNVPINTNEEIFYAVQPYKSNLLSNNNYNEEEGTTIDTSKVGHLSWYYASVHVCAQCYKVYNELDRLRKLKNKQLMHKQYQQLEENNMHNQFHWKEIEERIFKQRQFISRISQSDDFNHSNNNISNSDSNSNYLRGGNSSIFDDTQISSGGGIAFGRAFKGVDINQQRNKNNMNGVVRVPSKALPPIPWDLSNADKGEAYARSSTSILASRILHKIPDKSSSTLIQHHQKDKSSHNKLITTDDNNNDHGDDVDNVLKQWRELTSHHNDNNNSHTSSWKPRKMKSTTKTVTVESFNVDRLLHPWQRELNKIKNQKNNNSMYDDTKEKDGSYDDILNEVETMYTKYDQQQQLETLKNYQRSNSANDYITLQQLHAKEKEEVAILTGNKSNNKQLSIDKKKEKKSNKHKSNQLSGVILPSLLGNNNKQSNKPPSNDINSSTIVGLTTQGYTATTNQYDEGNNNNMNFQQYMEEMNISDPPISMNRSSIQSPMVFRPSTAHSNISDDPENDIDITITTGTSRSSSSREHQLRPLSRDATSPYSSNSSPVHPTSSNSNRYSNNSNWDTKESITSEIISIANGDNNRILSSPSSLELGPMIQHGEAVNRVSNAMLYNMTGSGTHSNNIAVVRRASSRPSMFQVESIPELVVGNDEEDDEEEDMLIETNKYKVNIKNNSTKINNNNNSNIVSKPISVHNNIFATTNTTTTKNTTINDDDDGESDESDDEEIGWSPFAMISHSQQQQ